VSDIINLLGKAIYKLLLANDHKNNQTRAKMLQHLHQKYRLTSN